MKQNQHATYKVKRYESSAKLTWDSFVKNSNQDTFLFQRNFMDYHSDRFEDFSLMIYKKDKLVALLPGNVVDNVVYSHQGITYGSLIYSKVIKTTDLMETFKSVLEFLNNNQISTLILKEVPIIYLHHQANNPLDYLLFKTRAELKRSDLLSVVDLNYKSYSSSRKEGVKRGMKFKLKVEESNSFDLFWNTILIPNLEARHQVKPVHSIEEITLLKSRYPDNIRQFNVFYEDEIVGGTTIFETENVAHCQYISGNEDKNKLGSLDYLHHYLIEKVFFKKKYFDFGTSNIRAGQHINEGLQFWKEGFGARSITQRFYKIDTENYKLLDYVLV